MGRIKDSIGRVIRWLRAAPIEIETRAPRFGHPCLLPPIGWYCTRGAGHTGPCAAYENSMFDEAAPITEADWRDLAPLPTVAAQLAPASALASRARLRISAGSRMLPPEPVWPSAPRRTLAHPIENPAATAADGFVRVQPPRRPSIEQKEHAPPRMVERRLQR